MKISVILPDDDVEFLERYRREHDLESRSAALAKAVKLLRESQLGPAYMSAWQEYDESGVKTL